MRILSSRVRSALLLLSFAILLAGCAASQHHRDGLSAIEKGELSKGVNELAKAVELAPQDMFYRKDWLEARENAVERLLAKASSAMSEHKPEVAAKHYRSILEFDANNSRALSGLDAIDSNRVAVDEAGKARDALKRGDSAEALQWANRALQRDPTQKEAGAVKREIEALLSKSIVAMPNLSALYKKPINLEFRDASIKMVFEVLSRTTGINFIFDRDVKGDQKTTVFLKQTTLEDAIDVLLTTNQLEKKILNSTSVLIYPNTQAKTKEYQDLMVKAFYLANVEAKQSANMLRTVLKLKDVFVDDKYNMVVLRETPETIVLAEKLIALQDLEEPEVMLEVEVLEVNRTRLMNLGIQFTDQFTISALNANTTGSSSSSGTASSPTLKLSDLLSLNKSQLSITAPVASVNIQKIDGDANLLANPRLRVRDREKAKILIGDRVPVVTSTTTPNGFLSENIQYLDVGLKLEVEPEIRLRDEIGLKMALEVSSVVAVVKTASGSQAYQIGTRNFNSALRLKDGETQVLAGLITDADRSSANRIPLLGDLPLLGRLFSSQKDDRQKTEIVLSITPHLIRNMRRKDPSAESFWSGTDANLRTKALLLGAADVPGMKQTPGATSSPTVAQQEQVAAPANTSGLLLNWKGPVEAKLGDTFSLDLNLQSQHALRALPLQLSYDKNLFEVVSVTGGEFLNRDGKGSFNHVIDVASGRVSISTSGSETGDQGAARVVTVKFKAKAAGEGGVHVIGLTPVGATKSVSVPPLPFSHRVMVFP
jgi:general secretion pathway protein D